MTGVFDEVTHVLIENQISTIASRMKTIQGLIAQTFIMGQVYDQDQGLGQISVEFISSHNKLKGYDLTGVSPKSNIPIGNSTNKKTRVDSNLGEDVDQPVEDEKTSNEKTEYKARKNDGIRIVDQYIASNRETIFSDVWKTRFGEMAKRDDLADCFLQAIWWLRFGSSSNSNKLISVADDLKINSVV
jgi:hypothetical protein